MTKKTITFFLIICFITTFSIPNYAIEYQLSPNDTLELKIHNQKSFNNTQKIGLDNTVSFPLIGRINTKGQTLASLEAELKKKYLKYLKNPDLALTLTPRPIYVVRKDTAGNLDKVIEVASAQKAKAYLESWTQGPDSEVGVADINYGDVVTVQKIQSIYVVQHDLKKNTWEVKEAATKQEAFALIGSTLEHIQSINGISYKQPKENSIDLLTLNPGDSVLVEIGNRPDFFEENWYKIITAVGVVVGILVGINR
jgi:hypothetical protein